MTPEKQAFRWGIERRLEFIEFRLFWEGGVNRSDLVEEFGVSVPQASKDLALYQEHAAHNIEYDKSLKRYFASNSFRPAFIKLDADAYLNRLTASPAAATSGEPELLHAEKLPIPQRRIRPEVLRAVLACVRASSSIAILYQSMSAKRPEPLWRRVSPHAFGSDGLRWHVRAFCHTDSKFKDFILSRCLEVRSPDTCGAPPSSDVFWESIFPVRLMPNPRLGSAQQSIIVEDFGMKDGEAVVHVRQALLYYFSKRLRLDIAEQVNDPPEAPVVVKNRADFDVALAEAMR
ncbi:TPA: WYL domain-containing protein [Stenotrophomonas maltophilia]